MDKEIIPRIFEPFFTTKGVGRGTGPGENGYLVFSATNAKEAMDIFKKEKGNFDLTFSDMVLPDKSGLQLVEKILEANPGIHILLTSGYTDDKSQWAMIRERGFRFLQKPYTIPDLLRSVRGVINKDK